jgi:SecD/SecF fusion protein
MQAKGVIRFFLVVMVLVTLIQFLMTIPTRNVENKADAYAEAASRNVEAERRNAVYKEARTKYLDSISSKTILSIPLLKNYTYQELKGSQLALGLDLKGGMSVVLQVDLKEFITSLSNNSKDAVFTAALEKAAKDQASTESDFITLFASAFREIGNGQPLAPLFARNEVLREDISFESSDGEVVRLLRQKANETVNRTFELLKQRIDKLGVTQPNVSLDAARDLIVVELPGIDNPERARTFLQAAAKLEFWDVYRLSDPTNPNNPTGQIVQQAFIDANDLLAKTIGTGEIKKDIIKIDTVYTTDSLGNTDSSKIARLDTVYSPFNVNQGPLFDMFTLSGANPNAANYGLAVMGVADRSDRSRIDSLLARQEVRNLFPRDLSFHWSRNPVSDQTTRKPTTLYQLFAIKREGGRNEARLSGDNVTRASADPDPVSGQTVVGLNMNNEGARVWKEMTTKAANDNNREIAILLDGEVVSAPTVNEPIPNGSSQISGNFTLQEAKDLASILEVGKLPAETRIIQESLVGPSLGQENIDRSITSLVLSFLIVAGFMILYYAGAGIFAVLALVLNLFFIIGALSSFGTVLTLPGIAGIVLTIGMAVDANVIIFERIREELRQGQKLLAAISEGFKHSYSAIIDGNVTTLLTGIVLAYFGLGPIKGFAVVLIIGVLCSLFTAVLVSRMLMDWWLGKNRSIGFSRAFSANILANTQVKWMNLRKSAYIFSGTLLAISLLSMAIRGFELGVDFKGGYSFNITFDKNIKISPEKLRGALRTAFEGNNPVVKAVDTENTYNVVTSYLINDQEEDAQTRVIEQLYAGVVAATGQNIDKAAFMDSDGAGTHITTSSKVGPTIADDISRSAFIAGTLALLVIFVYIFVRFSKATFGLGGVVALFHDTIITLGMFSLFRGILPFSLEIDQAFIAAILTVIGYSINDTVIVYDRIREYINLYPTLDKTELINRAINSTLSRTLITSFTTLFTVFVLFIFGGAAIRGFAFALLLGIGFGTYSSVFVASALLHDFTKGDVLADKAKIAKANSPGKGFSTKVLEKK